MIKSYYFYFILLLLFGCSDLDKDNANIHPQYDQKELESLALKELFYLHRNEIMTSSFDQYYSQEIGRRGKDAVYAVLELMPKKVTNSDYFGFVEILNYTHKYSDYNFCSDTKFKNQMIEYFEQAAYNKDNIKLYHRNIRALCDESIPLIIK